MHHRLQPKGNGSSSSSKAADLILTYPESKWLSPVTLLHTDYSTADSPAPRLTYNDYKNQTRTWESAERTTRAKGSGVDGVGILAILEKPTGPEILLQKQFRPPLNQVTIELPAGLVDEGESVQEAAVRELKEETGFVGTVSEMSPIMFNDPGMTNTNTAICSVQIDTTLPENQDPKPSLEDDEFIETFTTPLATLYAECKRLEAQGYAIDARVGTFAQGIELTKPIIGGTGAQGVPVVRDLLKSGDYSVRVLTRDANSARFKELQSFGPIEGVVGTFASEESLRATFRSAWGAFVNIDGFNSGEKTEMFWTIRVSIAWELAIEEGVKFYVHGNIDYGYKKSGFRPEFHCGHIDAKGRIAEWILAQNRDPIVRKQDAERRVHDG
ncbi:hypothetical protein EKO27_g9771, partial [Xylaria grammica]